MRGHVEVRESKIAGKGCFAKAAFRRGEYVGELTGDNISLAEARRRARGKRSISIVESEDGWALDATRSDSPARCINHSCDPNCYLRIGAGWVRFYARRPLRAGEELTCDYGETHHYGKLRCRCGVEDCRGRL